VVDEVQTGFCRTGRFFACEHHALVPDLLCLGKAIAGGVPMGAVAIGPRVVELPVGAHGSTFGGNPLACAAACAALDAMVDDGLAARSAELGAFVVERLTALDLPLVREVRGLGLMIGIELRQRVAPYLQALFARGVLALPAGVNVLRLLPPLVITRAELERVVEAIAAVLSEPSAGAAQEA
jgi:acetylornithine/LysW-gamma-L-lysine aminotransferase